MSRSDPRSRAVSQLRNAAGPLGTKAVAMIEAERPWFRDLGAEERAWVGQIVQSGIRGFVDWFAANGTVPPGQRPEHDIVVAVFGAAPRNLAGAIDLSQTVDLIRLTIASVEEEIAQLLDPESARDVDAAILRFGREVAFATAEVYARAAEVRGAWDARLEALVVDGVLRAETDEAVLSRASAVGWGARGHVAVVVGTAPGDRDQTDIFDAVRREARSLDLDALCAVQGHLLVVILGGVKDPVAAAGTLVGLYGDGPVIVGPVASDLAHAHASATAAMAGLRAATGWPTAPRPVSAHDLLPERVLAGDREARAELLDQVYGPISAGRGSLEETLATYFDNGSTIESTARALFVHPNTVRYRLNQIGDLTGFTPTRPRDALVLQIALVIGRQGNRPRDL